MNRCLVCGYEIARFKANFCDECGANVSLGNSHEIAQENARTESPPIKFRYGVVDDPAMAEAILSALHPYRTNQGDVPISAEDMRKLKTLNVRDTVDHFCDLEGLQYAENLRELRISSGGYPRLPSDRLATVAHFEFLSRLSGLAELSLGGLDLSDLDAIADLKELKSLNLHRLPISDLQSLTTLSNLTMLDLSELSVEDLRPLGNLSNLSKLDLTSLRASDLQPVSKLSKLKWLRLEKLPNLADLSFVAELRDLDTLYISQMPHLRNLNALSSLHNLEHLRLDGHTEYGGIGFPQIHDLGPLAALLTLKALTLDGFPHVRSLRPLAALARLEDLCLREIPEVKNLAPLGRLKKLQDLELRGMPKVKNYRPLASLTARVLHDGGFL